MNERIRQLAKQVDPVATIGNWGRVEWSDNVYPQLGDKMYASIDLEKFAELIVLKCAEIADSAEPFLASDLIKQHFGVEE